MATRTGEDRVSIVVPTRDRARRVARTVGNLLLQSHPDVEVVVSDDGSTDGTVELLQQIEDDRLVVVSGSASGVATARNRGIAASTGRWVAVCDDDDLWHPDKLAAQVALLRATSTRWGFCGAVSVTDDLRTLGFSGGYADRFEARLRQGNPVPGGCSSAIVDRRLLDLVEGFDPALSMFADYDLWIRLAATGAPVAVPDCLVLYVEHEGQMTRTQVLPAIDELRRVRAKHPELFSRGRDASPQSVDRWLVTRLRSAGLRMAALRYVFEERRAFGPSDVAALAVRGVTSRPRLQRPIETPLTLHPTAEAVRRLEQAGSGEPRPSTVTSAVHH